VALEAAEKAERVILRYFKDDIRASLKPDQSPVTLADQESEQVIIETIKKHFPDHGFLGEETGQQNQTSEFCWIIDPIDGTKNYLRKIPTFATQIALMHKGELVVGVSNAPMLHERMWAETRSGAYCNGSPIIVSERRTLADAFLVTGGLRYFERTNSLPMLLRLMNQTQSYRGYGDFWGYHLLAQGKADIMVEANTRIWDIAALAVIVREAGGIVTDATGQALSLQSNSAIAANPQLHPQVVKIFQGFKPLPL